MKKNKKTSLPLILACTYSLILLLAAYGKFFYPSRHFETLDRIMSVFELGLVFVLIFLRNHWLMWSVIAVINGLWGGYALFWHRLHLPCECLGSLFTLPTLLSILCDTLFLILSVWMASRLGAKKQALALSLICGGIGGWLGFSFASILYERL